MKQKKSSWIHVFVSSVRSFSSLVLCMSHWFEDVTPSRSDFAQCMIVMCMWKPSFLQRLPHPKHTQRMQARTSRCSFFKTTRILLCLVYPFVFPHMTLCIVFVDSYSRAGSNKKNSNPHGCSNHVSCRSNQGAGCNQEVVRVAKLPFSNTNTINNNIGRNRNNKINNNSGNNRDDKTNCDGCSNCRYRNRHCHHQYHFNGIEKHTYYHVGRRNRSSVHGSSTQTTTRIAD